MGFPSGLAVRNPPAMEKTQVPSLGGEDPVEEGRATTSVFLPRESHGQKSPAGYNP